MRSAAFWMVVGNGLYALMQMANLLVIGRVIGAEQAGIYSYSLAVVTPILLWTNLGLRTQIVTDMQAKVSLLTYRQVRLASSGVAFVAILATGLLFKQGLVTVIALALLAVWKIFENQSEVFFALLQRASRTAYIARSLALKSIVSGLVLAAVVFATHQLLLGLLAFAVSQALLVVTYDRFLAKVYTESAAVRAPVREQVMEVLRNGVPLGTTALLISLVGNLPRLFLGQYSGMAELGNFAAAAAFVQIGSLVVNSVGQASVHRLAAFHANGNRAGFRRLMLRLAAFACAAGVAGLVYTYAAGGITIDAVFGKNFAGSADVLLWLFAVAPVQYLASMSGYFLSAMRRNVSLMYIHGLTAATAVGACFLWIPRFGPKGAALAILSASTLACLLYVYQIRRGMRLAAARPQAPESKNEQPH